MSRWAARDSRGIEAIHRGGLRVVDRSRLATSEQQVHEKRVGAIFVDVIPRKARFRIEAEPPVKT